MVFPPGLLDNFAATYITSFYLPSAKTAVLNQLAQQFPSVTIIDMAVLLNQAQTLLHRVTNILQYQWLFTLLAGLLVLIVCVYVSVDERFQQNQLLRVLGASNAYWQGSLWVEFITLGLFVGLTGALLALGVSAYLAERVLRITYVFHYQRLMAGILLGIGLLTLPAWGLTCFLLQKRQMLR